MTTLRQKIPVTILGATGMVGQKFIELLSDHPWFSIASLAASPRSRGKKYGEIVNWQMATPLPRSVAEMILCDAEPHEGYRLAFSGLDARVAGEIEQEFANSGAIVLSNAKNHRMEPQIPLLIPEVNSEHLELIRHQTYSNNGCIITNPNCSVVGLTMALKPLVEKWGVSEVDVVTLQALSGSGYPGVSGMEIIDNVIPYIAGEEDKVETEPKKILGHCKGATIQYEEMLIRAHCNRVAVIDGHTECVTVKLKKEAKLEEIIQVWREFRGAPQELGLPLAPNFPIVYFDEEHYPQPRKQRLLGNGMSASIGRLRKTCGERWKFVVLSHNTIRGAAGGSLLNAELLVQGGFLDDRNFS